MADRLQGFLNDFVKPAFDEAQVEHLSLRRALIAACELDNLVERMILFEGYRGRDISARRDEIGGWKESLRLVRDIHDTHKHGALSRRSAIITADQLPAPEWHEGGFDSGFSSGFDISGERLILTDDNGQRHSFHRVLFEAYSLTAGLCLGNPTPGRLFQI